jgi:hypothetical protein
MRVHLSAWLALASVATYAACGSSDGTRTDQDAGAGGLGEGGETSAGGSTSTAGSKNTAGSTSTAGSKNGLGGEGGSGADGGSGGASAGEGGTGGDVPLGGEGGAAGAPPDTGLPAACPGVIGDYTVVTGTDGPDTFTAEQQTGKALILGLEGDDVIDRDPAGGDCLVAGPGDDDLTNPGEGMSYMIGGAGADTFHLIGQRNNYAQIVDMSAEDSIGLSKTTFPFLAGTTGDSPFDYQVVTVADYAAGTGLVPNGEGAAIVYDPATGGLYEDLDRGNNTTGATQLATILNHGSYTFELTDFVLDD